VLAVGASRIGAGQEKESGRLVNHDSPDVGASFGDAGAILDFELKTDQVRHLRTESGRVVLALAALCKS
jgi:hypothetical protein